RHDHRDLYTHPTRRSSDLRERGFAEGIALSTNGTVSEGAGENLFLVRDGAIVTPATTDSVLQGITRDAVMTLARDLGIPIREQRSEEHTSELQSRENLVCR